MRRRHGDELDAAIRAAVLDCSPNTARGVTMEAVAAAAQTSKPVLYRRWPDRAACCATPCCGSRPRRSPTRTPAATAATCSRCCAAGRRCSPGPQSAVLRAAVAAAGPRPRADGGVSAATSSAGARRRWPRCWPAASNAATCGADVPVEIARELGQSVLWHRLLITGDPITDDLVVQLVDEVLVPFVRPAHRPALLRPVVTAALPSSRARRTNLPAAGRPAAAAEPARPARHRRCRHPDPGRHRRHRRDRPRHRLRPGLPDLAAVLPRQLHPGPPPRGARASTRPSSSATG